MDLITCTRRLCKTQNKKWPLEDFKNEIGIVRKQCFRCREIERKYQKEKSSESKKKAHQKYEQKEETIEKRLEYWGDHSEAKKIHNQIYYDTNKEEIAEKSRIKRQLEKQKNKEEDSE